MKKILVLLTICLFLGSCAKKIVYTPSTSGPCTLKGFVYTADGKVPLKGATVRVASWQLKVEYWSEPSKKDGSYVVPNILPTDIPDSFYGVGFVFKNKAYNVAGHITVTQKEQTLCFTNSGYTDVVDSGYVIPCPCSQK